MTSVCTFLFSMTIVGAVEVQPGWMEVQHFEPIDNQIYTSHIYTDDYLSCWKNGLPVSGQRATGE